MALSNIRSKPANTGNRTQGAGNIGGAAVEVVEKHLNDGKVTISAITMFDSINLPAGTPITVHIAPENAQKVDDNLKKGMGTSKGSVLLLENCIKLAEGENQIQARWITTAISKVKSAAEGAGHDKREVEQAFLMSPNVAFENPNRLQDEPSFIHFGITSEKTRLKTPKGYADFDRAWIMEKLAQVTDHKKVRITALALQPTMSTKVASLDEAFGLIEEVLKNANGTAFVRVKDEDDAVERVIVRGVYGKEPELVVKDLKEAGLFRDIPNEAIEAELASGNLMLEVIPGVEIPFLGDSLQRIVKELATKPVADLTGFNITYGRDKRDGVSEMVLVTAPTNSGSVFFCHDPIRVKGEAYSLSYIPSPHFAVKEPVKADNQASVPQDQASNQAPAAEPGGESFDANDYDFSPADASGNPADDDQGQSTAQARRNPANR